MPQHAARGINAHAVPAERSSCSLQGVQATVTDMKCNANLMYSHSRPAPVLQLHVHAPLRCNHTTTWAACLA